MAGLLKGDKEWHHPLIIKPASGFSRRHMLGISGVTIAGLATLPNFAGVSALQASPEASPDAISGEPDAVVLLRDAVTAMTQLETFHFLVETTTGTTTFMDILEIDQIEGDIRRPFDFQTTVDARLFMSTIEITAVGIDGTIMIEDPTSETGELINIGADGATLSLLNPDILFLSSVGFLQNAALAGEEDFEGESTRKVSGTVSFPDLTDQFVNDDQPLPAELSTEPVEVLVWINQENLILGVEFAGPVLSIEESNVVRLITFSAFNEPVEITVPEV